jgi:tRNA uridine 5-carboxymethylaminomethyl modification enzyme
LLLREDNADLRLTPVGRDLGVVDDHRWQLFNEKRDAVSREQERLQEILVRPADFDDSDRKILGAMQRECRASDLLRRPELGYADLIALSAVGAGCWQQQLSDEQIGQVVQQLEVQARYAGYIERQQREIHKHAKQEALLLPDDIDYASVTGLSTEARQRLEGARPLTLGHASRLEGVTPSTVSLLLIHLKKRHLQRSA